MTHVSTLIHETDTHGTFSEFLHHDDGAQFAVLAPHGGQVEPNTDTEATLLSQRLDTSLTWGTHGIVNDGYDGAYNRWHTTGQTHPLSVFPLYQQLTSRKFEAACSLHVMQEDGIIIGGRADIETRESLQTHLEKYFPTEDVRLGIEGEPRAGMNPRNFVNALDTDTPIHIEQSTRIASDHPTRLTRSLAEWFATYGF